MDFEKFVIDTLEEIREIQNRTLIQATKTNGRVDRLEKWQEKYEETIDELEITNEQTKGRNKLLYGMIGVLATLLCSIIINYINKHK